jgi:hypothetical protein
MINGWSRLGNIPNFRANLKFTSDMHNHLKKSIFLGRAIFLVARHFKTSHLLTILPKLNKNKSPFKGLKFHTRQLILYIYFIF